MNQSVALINITRGALIESRHRLHIAVVNNRLETIAEAGLKDYVTFARSSAKPLQAIPTLTAGAAEKYGFGSREIALLCASHNGEVTHIEAVRNMLSAMGLDESNLKCGAHLPTYVPEADRLKAAGIVPGRIHNNCSGKHSGMLALGLLLKADLADYMDPGHPVQRAMLETIALMTDMPMADIVLGTDGCGVPVFGMPLDRLAYAFATLGKPERLDGRMADACRTIIRSIQEQPHYIAGTGRFDTRLIEVTGGRIVGKMGAEGVFALAVPELGLGLAVKIEDGAKRALHPAVVEALVQLDLLTAAESRELAEFHQPTVRNWEGTEVGQVLPAFKLVRPQ